MAVKTSEININVGGRDTGAASVLNEAGKSVDTLALKVKKFQQDRRASGELALDRMLSGDPDKALRYLLNFGPQVAIAQFALRGLAAAGDEAALHIKKLREGSENAGEAIMGLARSIPILGEAVKAGESIGGAIREMFGFENPEQALKKAEEFAKKQIEMIDRVKKARENVLFGDGVDQASVERRNKEEIDKLTNARRADADAAAAEADKAARKAYPVTAAGRQLALDANGNPTKKWVDNPERARQQAAQDAAVADAAGKARARVNKDYATLIESQERDGAKKIAALKDRDVVIEQEYRAKAVEVAADSRDRIAKLDAEAFAQSRRALGDDLGARLIEISAEADAEVQVIRKKWEEVDNTDGMYAEVEARRRKQSAEEDAARAEAQKARSEKVSAFIEKQRSLEQILNRERMEHLQAQAKTGDELAARNAALAEVEEKSKERLEKLAEVLASKEASFAQRMTAMAAIGEIAKDAEKARKAILQPGFTDAPFASLEEAPGYVKTFGGRPEPDNPIKDVAKNTEKSVDLLDTIASGITALTRSLGSTFSGSGKLNSN